MSTHTMHAALSRSVPVSQEKLGAPWLEIQASYAVHNRYLRIVVLGLSLAVVCLALAGWRMTSEFANQKPIVLRVNADTGTAEVTPYASLEYRPREPEMRHFLGNFVRDHYSRIRATARDAFQRKLFFLDAALARATMEEDQRTKSLQTFLSSGADEVDVYITNVVIEDTRRSPYKARVQFDKIFRAPSTRQETKREKYVASFVFTLLEKVPNNFIEVNPLGLVISYFREDQAF